MEVQLSGITTAPVELGSIAQSPATAAAIISRCTTTAAADWTGCRRGMRPRWNRATPCVSRRGPWWNLLPNLLTDIMSVRLVASVALGVGRHAQDGADLYMRLLVFRSVGAQFRESWCTGHAQS